MPEGKASRWFKSNLGFKLVSTFTFCKCCYNRYDDSAINSLTFGKTIIVAI